MATTSSDKQKEYYHKQRLDAESKADKGDFKSAVTAEKIAAKNKDSAKVAKYTKKAYESDPSPGAKFSRGLDRVSGAAGTAASMLAGGPEASVAGRGIKAAEGAMSKIPAASKFGEAVSGLAKGAVKKGMSMAKGAGKSVEQAASKASKFLKRPNSRNIEKVSKKGKDLAKDNKNYNVKLRTKGKTMAVRAPEAKPAAVKTKAPSKAKAMAGKAVRAASKASSKDTAGKAGRVSAAASGVAEKLSKKKKK